MKWFDRLKQIICRPQEAVVPAKIEHALKERTLTSAYDLFATMSQLEGIREICFTAGVAIMTLSDGRRYRFDMQDPVARLYTVPYTGSFEAKETEFLCQQIRPGAVCVDVGGSFGWYAVLLSRLAGDEGRVYSFEPLPANFRHLEENIALNQCTNVHLERFALAEIVGERELFLPDIGVSGSFALHEYKANFNKIPCQMITLDEYCRDNEITKVDFIKADIEGAEWLLLKGGKKTIERDRPMLLLEIQANSTRLFGHEPADVFGWLSEQGYRSYWVGENGTLQPVTDPAGPLPDHNFIFIADLVGDHDDHRL